MKQHKWHKVFPEGFDSSLNIDAEYLCLANEIMINTIGKREWDVPMCASKIMEIVHLKLKEKNS